MGSFRRWDRWLVGLSVVVLIAIAVTPFVVRNTDTLTVVLVALTTALLGLIIVRLVMLARDAAWRRDAWLVRNAQPRLNAILLVGQTLAALAAVALGGAFVYLAHMVGWALIVLGTGSVIVIAVTRWLSRQPVEVAPDTDGAESY